MVKSQLFGMRYMKGIKLFNTKKACRKTSLSDPDRTRTCDPQLRRLLLYPAELLDHHFAGAKILIYFIYKTFREKNCF